MLLRVVFAFILLTVLCFPGRSQQPKLMLPIGHTERVVIARFSPDSKLALTVSTDGTAKLWETASGKLLKDFKAGGDASIVLITDAWFSPAGKKAVLSYEGHSNRIYDIASGVLTDQVFDLNGKEYFYFDYVQFSPDRKKMPAISIPDGRLWMLDIETMKPSYILKTPNSQISASVYSHDGKKLLTYSSDNSIRTWDALTGKLLMMIKRPVEDGRFPIFSPDDKRVSFIVSDSVLITIDAMSGKTISEVKATNEEMLGDYAAYKVTPDGKFCLKLNQYHNYYDSIRQVQYWDSLSVYDRRSGKLIYALNNILIPASSDFLSPDGSRFLILKKEDSSVCMINTATGKELFVVPSSNASVTMNFSAGGKRFVTLSDKKTSVWDTQSGAAVRSLASLPLPTFDSTTTASSFRRKYDARLSANGNMVIVGSENKYASIFSINDSLIPRGQLKGNALPLLKARFDSTGKKIIIVTPEKNLSWDIDRGTLSVMPDKKDGDNAWIDWHVGAPGHGELIDSLMLVWYADIIVVENRNSGESYNFWSDEKELHYDVELSPDHKRLVATSTNNSIKIYDLKSSKPILRLVIFDHDNFIVVDSSNRYDGTYTARQMLYFTCGSEIVGLDQVKDQLWVPDLAQRTLEGETIHAKTLDEISICGLTPVIEEGKGPATEFFFKIKPRKGGLGETVVSFNETPTLSIQPSQLKKVVGGYELHLNKAELKAYFIPGQRNSISVKAFTAGNHFSSDNLTIADDQHEQKAAPPNLYAVMVGVSDYKGTELDLQYAAIDARDISKMLEASAKKLLGDDHVFMYDLTTDEKRDLLPEKKAIHSVFEEIGKKAGPNDILFIFLSGHGVMQDKSKQFYYMTAEASSLTDEPMFKNVGISMAELTEWIKPQKIKAQKRILILDACRSGQAINDLDRGFLAVKGDEKAQQLKAIDKLNEKSGLFILSASASSQLAFESGIFSHGYLTYALLKAIKERPDILEDGKYLNISRWFNTAAQTVSELAKQDMTKQEPQIVTNTDFNVGLVDDEIIGRIDLSETGVLFTSGNFLNNAEADDDLFLRKLIDMQFGVLARAEAGKKIFFVPSTNSSEAYFLTGGYSVKENTVTIKVNLKQDKITKHQFDLSGTKEKLNELVDAIIEKAIEWIEAHKKE